jgi:hypothetical protein
VAREESGHPKAEDGQAALRPVWSVAVTLNQDHSLVEFPSSLIQLSNCCAILAASRYVDVTEEPGGQCVGRERLQ